MARFITDENAAAIAASSGTAFDQMRPTVANASKLWRQIRANEWIDGDDLRQWATDQGMSTDDYNSALSLLNSLERIYEFDDSPVTTAAPPIPEPVLPPQSPDPSIRHGRSLDEMKKTELRNRAAHLGIEGRTKMSEDELRDAIRGAEAG